jgi:hypothetical protein
MGSNQFEVHINHKGMISLTITEGPNVDDLIELPDKKKFNVGRKATN